MNAMLIQTLAYIV
jgi:hypothetical protein